VGEEMSREEMDAAWEKIQAGECGRTESAAFYVQREKLEERWEAAEIGHLAWAADFERMRRDLKIEKRSRENQDCFEIFWTHFFVRYVEKRVVVGGFGCL
jgi:hypothetical protein